MMSMSMGKPSTGEPLADPYSSGLDMTLEGFGKSKKSFNASDMFGVAAAKEEEKASDQDKGSEEPKKEGDTRYG